MATQMVEDKSKEWQVFATALSEIRAKQRISPKETYATPSPELLSAEWLEERAVLDRETLAHLGGVSQLNKDAEPAKPSSVDGVFNIPHDTALPLIHDISYRFVSDAHLFIGVLVGTGIVLGDDDSTLMMRLKAGLTPLELVHECESNGMSVETAWSKVMGLISRLVSNGFIRGIKGHVDEEIIAPHRFMRVHLTQSCNLACVHCYADSSPVADTTGQLTVDEWKRIISDFAQHGGEQILFTGGEALLYKGCDELLRHAKASNLYVTLFSNGIKIPQYLDVIKETCDKVQISIDGPHAESNDPIRGNGSFDRATKAVDILLKAGVKVRIGMVVMDQNFDAVSQDFHLLYSRWNNNLLEWRLGYGLTTHGRGEEMEDHIDFEKAKSAINAMKDRYEPPTGQHIFRKKTSCGYCEQVVVAQDGQIHPCHLLDGGIMHVHDQPFGELLELLRREAEDYVVDNNLGCQRCDIRNLCGGTCRVDNGKTMGNRRLTNCRSYDKLHKLKGLVQLYGPQQQTIEV